MGKAIETKQAIFDAAIELVRQKGYADTNIVDICEACGITKPTFYYYYKSKEDIFANMDFHSIVDKTVLPLILRAENPWQQMNIYMIATLKQFALAYGKEVLRAAVISSMATGKNPFAFITPEQSEVTLPLVKKAQEMGIVRNHMDAEKILMYSTTMFVGTLLMWVMGDLEGDIYQLEYESAKAFYDVPDEYDFPLDMYK